MKAANIRLLEDDVARRTTLPFAAVADEAGRDALRATLAEHGFAVVTGVVDAADVAAAEGCFDADLAAIVDRAASPDVRKANKLLQHKPLARHWPLLELPVGAPGRASEYGLPHGRCAWFVRAHPNVRAVYAALFGTAALCASTDNVFYDPRAAAPGSNAAHAERLWPHADQNAHLGPEGCQDCFQGVVYLWPGDADSSLTVVWPGSNGDEFDALMHTRFANHWCPMAAEENARFAEHARRVPVPAGGLLLWNSRTIHQGWGRGQRLAVPVCMEPTERRCEKARRTKEQCVRDGRPTTHWASLGIPHGSGAKSPGNAAHDAAKIGVALRATAHNHCVADGDVAAHLLALL
jgi:hypothetical protein